MNDATKTLGILQVAIPADTPLTVSSEITILEVLGIVKDPQMISVMQMVSALVPPSTPATLKGLVQMLGTLMRMSSKATTAHHKSITKIQSELDAIEETDLTFGTFLSVCQTLIESPAKAPAVRRKKRRAKGK
jgi:hypothetical protein